MAHSWRDHATSRRGVATPDPDPGLFGPDSVTWRIHADPSMAVAGFRALLLQAVHPVVMAGFDANTDYRDDPWGRLQRTGEWIATVTFGDTEEAEAAGRALRRVHARLTTRVETEDGRRWRVSDPELLLWVHCTQVESFMTTYRRSGGRLSDEDADRYVAEMVTSARLVGLRPADVPASVAELDAYFERVRPLLGVSAAARRNVWWTFLPPMPRWVRWGTPARPAWVGLMSLAAAMLPPWARRLYGLPGLPVTDMTARLTSSALRRAILAVPGGRLQSPAHQAALARLGLGDEPIAS